MQVLCRLQIRKRPLGVRIIRQMILVVQLSTTFDILLGLLPGLAFISSASLTIKRVISSNRLFIPTKNNKKINK